MPSPTKRGAEARGSTEPSPTRIRIEEPAAVQERPERVPKVSKVKLPEPGFTGSEAEDMRVNAKIRTLSDDDPMSESSTSSEFRARLRRVCSLKSIKDVEKLLEKEELRYNDDDEVDIEEFEGLEVICQPTEFSRHEPSLSLPLSVSVSPIIHNLRRKVLVISICGLFYRL